MNDLSKKETDWFPVDQLITKMINCFIIIYGVRGERCFCTVYIEIRIHVIYSSWVLRPTDMLVSANILGFLKIYIWFIP